MGKSRRTVAISNQITIIYIYSDVYIWLVMFILLLEKKIMKKTVYQTHPMRYHRD